MTMTLVRIKDEDIGQRSAGCESDVIYSLSRQPRGHKQTWEIRNKTLPKVNTMHCYTLHCTVGVAVGPYAVTASQIRVHGVGAKVIACVESKVSPYFSPSPLP